MILAAERVSYAIGGASLLSDIDVRIAPGRLVVIIGPNGAGKSTLLRVLTGELKPVGGRVVLGEQDIRKLSPSQLSRFRAVVPQQALLEFPFTVIEVVQLGVTVPGLVAPGAKSLQLAKAMLERMGLLDFADRDYSTLSGGERQRVHIARALCQLEGARGDRPLGALFVDEPTSSLDIAHQLQVLSELRSQAEAGRLVVAILHDLNLAAAYADDVLLLDRGVARAVGAPGDVLSDELLSAVYRCQIRLNQVPDRGAFLLPQTCALPN